VDRYLAAKPDVIVASLPTYAPKLNPADGIWRYVKYGRLANYTPPDLAVLRATVNAELSRLRALPDLLRSFIRFTKLLLDV
jgi:putative transposase